MTDFNQPTVVSNAILLGLVAQQASYDGKVNAVTQALITRGMDPVEAMHRARVEVNRYYASIPKPPWSPGLLTYVVVWFGTYVAAGALLESLFGVDNSVFLFGGMLAGTAACIYLALWDKRRREVSKS